MLEEEADALPLAGRLALRLPTFELPVSSLKWSAWLPRSSEYSALEGDVAAQRVAGTGRWYQAPLGVDEGLKAGLGPAGGGTTSSGDAGAMPVRIDIPKSGRRLDYSRYWLEADQPVEVRAWHVRGWVKGPLALLGAAGLIAGFAFLGPALAGAEPTERRRLAALSAGILLVCCVAVASLAGVGWLILAGMLASGALSWRIGLHEKVGPAARAAWERARNQPATPPSAGGWAQRNLLSKGLLIVAWGWLLFLGLVALGRLLFVVPHPLGG